MTALSAVPLIPLEIRVRTLEAQILGASSSYNGSIQHATKNRPITRRVTEISENLERAVASDQALKSFISGYQAYLPLLELPLHPSQNETDPSSEPVITKSDFMPDSVRATMVLESAQDIINLERDLREVEVLKAQGVEGAGQLEELLPYRSDLLQGFRRSQTRSKEVDKARQEVSDLLRRYNDFTSTVSELFLDLHHRMEGMEDMVSDLERKKRRELAERF